jgi:PAS domain S-box-containing protein
MNHVTDHLGTQTPDRESRRSLLVLGLALVVILVLGVLGSIIIGQVIRDGALSGWHERIERVGEDTAKTLSEWLDRSVDVVFALETSFRASRWIEAHEFAEVMESFERKAPQFFPNSVVFALPLRAGDGRIVWEAQLSSDLMGPYSPGSNLTRLDFVQSAILGARAIPGQLVLGPVQRDSNQRLAAAAALVISNGSDKGVLLAILDFDRILQGLHANKIPAGVSLRLFNRFVIGPKALFDHAQIAGTETAARGTVKTVTTRLTSGGNEFLLQLDADSGFLGGPNTVFADTVMAFGLLVTLFAALFIAFLVSQNRTIKRRVDEATVDLEKQTLLLTTIFDSMTQGIVAFDKDLKLVSWNDRFMKIRGYPKELAHTGTDFADFMNHDVARGEFGPDDPELGVQEQVVRANRFDPHEFERQRPDGTFIEVRGGPIPGGGFVSTYTDVTKRKRAEAELRKLSHAVEQSPASVVITDPAGTIEYVNPKFTEVTGYTAAEALGRNPRILKSGRTPPGDHANLWKTISAGLEWRGEFINLKKDGSEYWEFASISPITDAAGAITHFLAVKEDITERKRAETELSDKMDELERFSKIAVGRELRMIELKEEINALRKQLGRDPIYEIVD